MLDQSQCKYDEAQNEVPETKRTHLSCWRDLQRLRVLAAERRQSTCCITTTEQRSPSNAEVSFQIYHEIPLLVHQEEAHIQLGASLPQLQLINLTD